MFGPFDQGVRCRPRRARNLVPQTGVDYQGPLVGNDFSRGQKIRDVKASHANSVVSHPVINVEAVR
jgi:hypothetical protein